MIEVNEHKAYELLKNKYERVCLDYVILLEDKEYEGVETHKRAIFEAFQILNTRFACYDYSLDIKTERMLGMKSSIEELLQLPTDSYYDSRPRRDRSYNIPSPIPYWFAFLEPPYGTPYLKSDFVEFNNILFPNREDTEVYRWNDDFSNYFDTGKEWWGTGLWTIVDKTTGLIVVIGASLTD